MIRGGGSMKNTLQAWKRLWNDLGTRRWIFLFLVGILLVVIAMPTGEKTNPEYQDNVTETRGVEKNGQQSSQRLQNASDTMFTWNGYEAQLEARLTALLSQIHGAGKVQVMVTIGRSSELVLQNDTTLEEDIIRETDPQGGIRDNVQRREESQTVLTGGSGSSQPYVVSEIMPRVEGVVVACEGGDRPTVQAEISAAVQALFDLAPHKIKVCKMASP